LFVSALSILITVTVIRRYLDRLEARKWAPARDRAYYRLFQQIHGLMSHVPYHHRIGLRRITYRFGSHTIGGFDYGGDFMQGVRDMDASEFEPAVEHWSSSPDQIAAFQRTAERLSEPEIAVFTAREPELGRAIGVVRERILQAAYALGRYRRAAARETPSRDLREYFNVEGTMKGAMDRAMDQATERRIEEAEEEAMEQACLALYLLVMLLTIYTSG